MTIEDQIEQDIYKSVVKLTQIPRPHERERICMEVINFAVKVGGFKIVELKNEQ